MLTLKQIIQDVRKPSSMAHALLRSSPRIAMMAGFENLAWQILPLSNQGIHDVIHITKPESFVEIGVGKGATLKSYLNAAEAYTDEVRYIGFDTFSEGPPENETPHLNHRIQNVDQGSGFWKMHHTSREVVQSIPDSYEVECQLRLIEGNTRETLPDASSNISPVDLVYIDGGHSYDTVRNDYEGIKPMLKHSTTVKEETVPSGTIVVLDDFNCEVGVTKFVYKILSKKDPEFKDVMFTPAWYYKSGCVTTVLSF